MSAVSRNNIEVSDAEANIKMSLLRSRNMQSGVYMCGVKSSVAGSNSWLHLFHSLLNLFFTYLNSWT